MLRSRPFPLLPNIHYFRRCSVANSVCKTCAQEDVEPGCILPYTPNSAWWDKGGGGKSKAGFIL